MATKDQYEFFRSLYLEEERTYEQIEGRAKVYLSIITAFLVAMLLKADDLAKSAGALGVSWLALMMEAFMLALALVFVVLAIRIRAYEAVTDPVELLESFEGEGPTDDEFFEDRIVDFAVASKRNLDQNNRAARLLAWAGRLLVVSMLLLLFIFLFALKGAS